LAYVVQSRQTLSAGCQQLRSNAISGPFPSGKMARRRQTRYEGVKLNDDCNNG